MFMSEYCIDEAQYSFMAKPTDEVIACAYTAPWGFRAVQIAVAAVWAISCALCAMRFHWAQTVFYPRHKNGTDSIASAEPQVECISNIPKHNQELWDCLFFLLFYVIPLAIISTLYSRIGIALWASTKVAEQPGASPSVVSGRRRAVRLLAAIVTTFAVCHLPLHGRRLWQHWSESHKHPSHLSTIFASLTFLAAYANSAVNPLLYSLLSRNFRVSIGHLLRRCIAATTCPSQTFQFPDVNPRRCKRRRCSPGESDSSPQTTLTYRGDSVRITIVKDCDVPATALMLTDESGRDLVRGP